jgi:RNA polymerase sigma-70 factor (ECF subfamily)
MHGSSAASTSPSLLERLRRQPDNQAAWAEFVRRYGRQIYRWCRRWQLQPADAEEVTQAVLLKLAVKLRTFTYDPAKSFRAYLKALTKFAWRDFLADGRRPDAAVGGSEALRRLETAEARDDLVQHLSAEFDRELLEEAMARVQQRVEAHTWEAFRLVALEGRRAAEVAAALGIKTAAVYVIKGRVQKMIQEEVQRQNPEDLS